MGKHEQRLRTPRTLRAVECVGKEFEIRPMSDCK